jgi:putative ATPase
MNFPLSEKLRPSSLTDVFGQDHLLKEDGIINTIINSQHPLSILLFGPPGSGKTTLARLYAKSFNAQFVNFSAIFNGIADLKKIIQSAKDTPLIKVILFVDEIHRFNKSQQDAFLPYLEDGTITLIGATTENPSFSLNSALLSRLRVVTLNPLSYCALEKIINRYQGLREKELSENVKDYLIRLSNGDGRYLLNLIENIESIKDPTIKNIESLLQRKAPNYDKHGENHFNLISALHKAIRGSDPDASIYWLCRMLIGGEEPLYIIRRLIRIASEDIGLADSNALQIAINAHQTYKILGSPEGELAIAQATIYLALSPKSNSVYTAFEKTKTSAKQTHHLPPPKKILNAPTSLLKDLGYGKEYAYDHDTPDSFSGQNYFPDNLPSQKYYSPKHVGFERELEKRLRYFEKLKEKIKNENN